MVIGDRAAVGVQRCRAQQLVPQAHLGGRMRGGQCGSVGGGAGNNAQQAAARGQPKHASVLGPRTFLDGAADPFMQHAEVCPYSM